MEESPVKSTNTGTNAFCAMGDKHAIPRAPRPDAKPGLKLRLEDRLGILDPITILAFDSFGTEDGIRLRGRVVEDRELKSRREKTPTWRNVRNMLQRLASDEIPGALLRVHLQGRSWETTTDSEGYFVFDIDLEEPLAPGWHEVPIELADCIGKPEVREVVERVLIPSPDAEYAVVSDLDDTVIETRDTDVMQRLTTVFGKDATQRVPFPGVPRLYRALARGSGANPENPIFYVSNSGWNLHDLFADFMEHHDIPKGPMFLSDLRIVEEKSRVLGSDEHKFENAEMLLRIYPELRFVLIGDSGMRDPELYLEIVRAHAGRILAIYIHDVADPKRGREVDDIARHLREEHDVPLVHGDTTLEVAEHAAEHNLIRRDALEEIRREVGS